MRKKLNDSMVLTHGQIEAHNPMLYTYVLPIRTCLDMRTVQPIARFLRQEERKEKVS